MISALGLIASEYARGGAAVFPLHTPTTDGCSCRRAGCDNVGKHPRTLHGLSDATTDVDQVETWWRIWPEANIGLRPARGQVVLDIDPRHGGDVQLGAMQRLHGELPGTRTALTGGGGLHLWFHGHGELVGHLASGIDVKTHDGYLVAPPSAHGSGRLYAWSNAGPIVDAPDYLMRLLRRPRRPVAGPSRTASPAVLAGLARVVREAQEGERNRRLYWACARAHEKGIDTGFLVDAAVERGLSRRAAERTADSAADAPPLPNGGAA